MRESHESHELTRIVTNERRGYLRQEAKRSQERESHESHESTRIYTNERREFLCRVAKKPRAPRIDPFSILGALGSLEPWRQSGMDW